LTQNMAPEAWAELLTRFTWRISSATTTEFVLPDCVVLSWSDQRGYQSLLYDDKDMEAVLMPLSPRRLLIGERKIRMDDGPAMINEASATCSWSFFVARNRAPELDRLVPKIGNRIRKWLEKAVQEAMEQSK
jgi:hypothetical protein